MTALAAFAMLLCAGDAPAADTAVLAAKIVPVEGQVIDHGVILIGGGKILALGTQAKLKIPPEAAVIDARDLWAMPGIVEAHTHIGLDGGLNDMVFPINPDLSVAPCIDLDSPLVKKALEEGVTTVNSMPGSGTNHAGFSVIFKLAAAGPREAIVRDPGCLKIAQAFNPERDTGDMGATRTGMAYMLRRLLIEGREYAAAWREHEAQRRDLPKRWVVSDEALLEIARRAPADGAALLIVRGLNEQVARRNADEIIRAICRGQAVPDDELPKIAKRKRVEGDASDVADLLSALLRLRAREHGVAPTLIATRDELERFAAGERDENTLASGWRHTLVGAELALLLEGALSLRVVRGHIVIDRVDRD
jgi:hypothetical protein